MLLDRLQKLARLLYPGRHLMLLLSLLMLGLAAYAATATPSDSRIYLTPAIVGLLWSLSGYAFILNFQGVPSLPDKHASIWLRLGIRCKRLWFWLLALLFVTGSLALLWLSLRLLLIWLAGY